MHKQIMSITFLILVFVFSCKTSNRNADSDLAAQAPRSIDKDSPNVLYIILDDVGYGDINYYYKIFNKKSDISGYTNNIDSLAQNGVTFSNMYASPMCTSSRAQFLTSCYPSLPQVNLKLHENFGFGLPDSKNGRPGVEYTFAEYMRMLGYRTALVGKWHLGDAPENLPPQHGFDLYYGTNFPNDGKELFLSSNSSGKVVTDTTTNYASHQHDLTDNYLKKFDEFVAQNKNKQFFTYLSLHNIHEDVDKLLVRGNVRIKPIGDQPYAPKNFYLELIKDMDDTIGAAIDSLRRHGVLENTIVVVTSDNGPQWDFQDSKKNVARRQIERTFGLREGKDYLYEGGVRVPHIIYGPRYFKPGQLINDRISTIDMMPTLLGVVNYYEKNTKIGHLISSKMINGVDVSALFTSDRPSDSARISSIRNFLNLERPLFLFYENHTTPSAVIKGQYKYLINRYTEAPELYPSSTFGSKQGDANYNLVPNENTNLIHNSAYGKIRERLAEELKLFAKNGHDKLRDKVDEDKSERMNNIRKSVAAQHEARKKKLGY